MAFPTTSILSSFTGSDGFLASVEPDFSTGFGANPTRRVGNAATNNGAAGNYVGSYWDTETFGPDSEAYITATSASVDYMGVYLRLADPGGSTYDGYQAAWSVSTVTLVRKVNGADDATLDSASVTLATGAKLGIEAIGTTIKVYTDTGGGWVERCSATDSTYTGAGYIGFDLFRSGVMDVDDFGGGDVVASGGPSQRFRWRD